MFGRNTFGRPIQRSSMSIQKQKSLQKVVQPTMRMQSYNSYSPHQNLKTPFNGNGALIQQRFSAILRQQSVDTAQVGILLKFTVPAYAGQRKRYLKIKKSQLTYVNFLDDHYPCSYSLAALQVDGILNMSGTPTKQIVTMPIQQITTNISNDFMTLNLLYQTQDKDQYMIDITNVPALNFYLVQQLHATQKVSLPLASHLIIQFSIFRSIA